MKFRIFKTEAERTAYLEDVRDAARAVISEGRPHGHRHKIGSFLAKSSPCQCYQCAAWDALAELFK